LRKTAGWGLFLPIRVNRHPHPAPFDSAMPLVWAMVALQFVQASIRGKTFFGMVTKAW
jgi:hypothetical protein